MRRQLTAEEYLSVQLATRRESYSHRRWPQEVVRAIVATDLEAVGEGRRAAGPIQALALRLRARLRGRRRGVEGFAAA